MSVQNIGYQSNPNNPYNNDILEKRIRDSFLKLLSKNTPAEQIKKEAGALKKQLQKQIETLEKAKETAVAPLKQQLAQCESKKQESETFIAEEYDKLRIGINTEYNKQLKAFIGSFGIANPETKKRREAEIDLNKRTELMALDAQKQNHTNNIYNQEQNIANIKNAISKKSWPFEQKIFFYQNGLNLCNNIITQGAKQALSANLPAPKTASPSAAKSRLAASKKATYPTAASKKARETFEFYSEFTERLNDRSLRQIASESGTKIWTGEFNGYEVRYELAGNGKLIKTGRPVGSSLGYAAMGTVQDKKLTNYYKNAPTLLAGGIIQTGPNEYENKKSRELATANAGKGSIVSGDNPDFYHDEDNDIFYRETKSKFNGKIIYRITNDEGSAQSNIDPSEEFFVIGKNDEKIYVGRGADNKWHKAQDIDWS